MVPRKIENRSCELFRAKPLYSARGSRRFFGISLSNDAKVPYVATGGEMCKGNLPW